MFVVLLCLVCFVLRCSCCGRCSVCVVFMLKCFCFFVVMAGLLYFEGSLVVVIVMSVSFDCQALMFVLAFCVCDVLCWSCSLLFVLCLCCVRVVRFCCCYCSVCLVLY